MISSPDAANVSQSGAGRLLSTKNRGSKNKVQSDLRHASYMNLNSYDILSLFREMESAIRRVLAHKL